MRVLLAVVTFLGVVAAAWSQRYDTPPRWAVGNWVGHSDVAHNDVDLQLSDDGRAMITFRVGTNVQTFRGGYRSDRLDVGGTRYFVRRSGDDIELAKENDRRDSVTLHRVGRPDDRPGRPGRDRELTIESPRNNERIRGRTVEISGDTDAREVSIEIRRDRQQVYNNNVPARNGHYEVRVNLSPGKYEATVRTRGERLSLERKVVFNLGGVGRTSIESPRAGGHYDTGTVVVSGTSDAEDVEIEIYRGRDRIFITRVPVRDGEFSARPNLTWGHYDLTVRALEDGKVIGTDRRGFEVDPSANGPDFELRIDRPRMRESIRGRSVDFEGTSNSRQVRIEVFRGRDRVFNQLVDVRDGRFRTRSNFDEGHYDVVFTAEERGRAYGTRRVTFDLKR